MADLTTLAAVKAYANVTGSGDDKQIQTLVGAVSMLIHGIIGIDYEGETITAEKHSGPSSGLILLEKPAAVIDEVREDSTTLDSSAYELENERLLYRLSGGKSGPWAFGLRNVEVDYTTTTEVPEDLELAARESCAFMVKQTAWTAGAARMGLSAQANADSGTADYFAQSLRELPMTKATLDRYKRFY